MSLAIKYETVEDATLRLKNTVVRYKGDLVLIKEIGRGDDEGDILRVLFQPLPTDPRGEARILDPDKAQKRKYISSKHFDISPIKLGYVNSPDGVFYCARLPSRVQKQGLCHENFKGSYLDGRGAVNFSTFLSCKETLDMAGNHYPSFEEAHRLLQKVPAIAFSRDFCLLKDVVLPDLIYLYHKNTKVGYWSKNEIAIGRKYECLKESLTEMKLRVGVCQ